MKMTFKDVLEMGALASQRYLVPAAVKFVVQDVRIQSVRAIAWLKKKLNTGEHHA